MATAATAGVYEASGALAGPGAPTTKEAMPEPLIRGGASAEAGDTAPGPASASTPLVPRSPAGRPLPSPTPGGRPA